MRDDLDYRTTQILLYIFAACFVIAFNVIIMIFAIPYTIKQSDAASLKTAPEAFYGYKPLLMALKSSQPQENMQSGDSTDDIEQWKANVTAYTAIETCKDRCIMANGKRAYYGAAACPRRIPLGTLIDVDGLGVFVCEDRTAQWTDGNIDIFFGYEQADYQRAIQFGAQVKTITINHSL